MVWGRYGDGSRSAQERGVCRQSVSREAAGLLDSLEAPRWRQQVARLQEPLRQGRQRLAAGQAQLAQAVVLDRDQQAEVACVAQAMGIRLPEVHTLLDTLRPGHLASVAPLGRWTKAAGQKSAALVAVVDVCTRARVRQAAADEIDVTDPLLMVVEPESLCWVSGRLTAALTHQAWAEELRPLPAGEQGTREGGTALGQGVKTIPEERQHQEQPALADQRDHFHSLRGGRQGLRKLEGRLRSARAEAGDGQTALDRRRRHGQSANGFRHKARERWAKASRALDTGQERDAVWQKTKAALSLITPAGELQTRTRAEALLAQTRPQLPEAAFAQPKRMRPQPQTLTSRDAVQRKLAAVPIPPEVRHAAVRQEGLRRRPELLPGHTREAAA